MSAKASVYFVNTAYILQFKMRRFWFPRLLRCAYLFQRQDPLVEKMDFPVSICVCPRRQDHAALANMDTNLLWTGDPAEVRYLEIYRKTLSRIRILSDIHILIDVYVYTHRIIIEDIIMNSI